VSACARDSSHRDVVAPEAIESRETVHKIDIKLALLAKVQLVALLRGVVRHGEQRQLWTCNGEVIVVVVIMVGGGNGNEIKVRATQRDRLRERESERERDWRAGVRSLSGHSQTGGPGKTGKRRRSLRAATRARGRGYVIRYSDSGFGAGGVVVGGGSCGGCSGVACRCDL